MPTVPSVPVSLFSSRDIVVPNPVPPPDGNLRVRTDSDRMSGPTPDPEMDDEILIPVMNGSATSDNQKHAPSHRTSFPPRRLPSLTNLVLHSPSSILGTPLDPTARFEYPFPIPTETLSADADFSFYHSMFPPPSISGTYPTSPTGSFTSILYHAAPAVPLLTPTLSVPTFVGGGGVSMPPPPVLVAPRSKTLQLKMPTKTKEPPVPPSLVKKRLSAAVQVGVGIAVSERGIGVEVRVEEDGGVEANRAPGVLVVAEPESILHGEKIPPLSRSVETKWRHSCPA
ncbi:hypothetical protein JAAARDRAFT_33815 [Jaapia argillacea MUCL 33604]|uniref:Uncharacterized protein n=1 Tax=Jaapia argillacea MUCL 33604 TaxID=933084 RepID=A0A067PYW4_9AGAM|nr:hypothetical protein JAAARDRAFT_33815 [Jaapia argillacea MUCL 33604]